MGLDGAARLVSDLILTGLAALGLLEVFKAKEKPIQQGIDSVAPISRETQMVIMYGAFAYSLAKVAWDATHQEG